MITMDDTGLFGKALLTKFQELIGVGELKLMPGNPSDVAAIESMPPLATIKVSSLGLVVADNQIRITGTPQFDVLRTGTITWWMLDCRQTGDAQNAPNNGYIKGDVSFTGSPSVQREAAELQLNTLLITAGDGGVLSEITPVQFSIKLG